jgi:uncharacterized membrane protein
VPTPRLIALLYCIYASLAVLLLATTIPPMQNPDETNHSFRADQVSRLVLAGQVIPDGEFGGVVSSGIAVPAAATSALRSHPERKVTRAMLAPSAWGVPIAAGFPNTAVNPPIFYIPAAVADALARDLRIRLPHALILMRIATGFVTIAIAAAAIALAGSAALWLFAMLLLPMSLAVSAAISQDGPMLASTALAASLYLRLQAPKLARKQLTFVCLCLLLTMVGMARSPYIAFALLTIAVPVKRSWRIAGAAIIFACVIAWSAHSMAHFPLPFRPGGIVSPSLQCMSLITHPWRVPLLAFRTLRAYGDPLAHGFIGQLGWLDTALPAIYDLIAWTGLGVALLATWRPRLPPVSRSGLALEALAVIGSAGGVCLIQYMIWTAVGSPLIDGLQGRYFLAPALLFGALLSSGTVSCNRVQNWLALPVLALPVLSIAVTLHAVIVRYYL